MSDSNLFLTARKKREWTQKQAACAIGVKQPTIVNWEHGKVPSPRHWGAVEREYGISRRRLERMFLDKRAA